MLNRIRLPRLLLGILGASFLAVPMAPVAQANAEPSVSFTPQGSVTRYDVSDPLTFELDLLYDYKDAVTLPDTWSVTTSGNTFKLPAITFHEPGSYTFYIKQPVVKEHVTVCNCGAEFRDGDSSFALHASDHILKGEDDGYWEDYLEVTRIKTDDREWFVNLTVAEKAGALSVTKVSYGRSDGVTNTSGAAFLTVNADIPKADKALTQKVDDVLAKMSLEERVAQCFLLPYSAKDSVEIQPAGYFLSRKDFTGGSKERMAKEINALQWEADVPYLIMTSEEGGSMSPASGLPSYRESPFEAPQALAASGASAARSDAKAKADFLSSMGINFNLGPVADVSGESGFLYNRTYGGDGLSNAPYVKAAVSGITSGGVGCVLPHFPGYGSATGDTSRETVTNSQTGRDLDYNDWIPFRTGLAAGADGLLMTHNIYTAFHASLPASLDTKMYETLREELHFDGMVMTDNCSKAALSAYSYPERQALQAGADLIWTDDVSKVSNAINAVKSGTVSEERVNEAARRVLLAKAKRGILDLEPTSPVTEAAYQSSDGRVSDVGSFSDMWAAAEANGNGTVTLQEDVSIDASFSCSGKATARTLDLNGHILTFSGTGAFVTVPAGYSFTLSDASHALSQTAGTEAPGLSGAVFTWQTPDGTKQAVHFKDAGRISGTSADVLLYGTGGTVTVAGGALTGAATGVQMESGTVTMTGGGLYTLKESGILLQKGATGTVSGGYLAGTGTGIVNHGTLTVSGAILGAGAKGIVNDGTLTVSGQSGLFGHAVSGIESSGSLALSGRAASDGMVFVNGGETVLSGRIQMPITLDSGQTMDGSGLEESAVVTVTLSDTGTFVRVLHAGTGTGITPADPAYTMLSQSDGVYFAKEAQAAIPVTVTVNGETRSLGALRAQVLGSSVSVSEADLAAKFLAYGYPGTLAVRTSNGIEALVSSLLDGTRTFDRTFEDDASLTLQETFFTVTVPGQATGYAPAGKPFEITLPEPEPGFHWEGPGMIQGSVAQIPSITEPVSYVQVKDAELIHTGSLTLTNKVIRGEGHIPFVIQITDADGNDGPFQMNGIPYVGSVSLELGPDESVTLTDIPEGSRFVITAADQGCPVTIQINGETAQEASGIVQGDEVVDVLFTHTFPSGQLPNTGSSTHAWVIRLAGIFLGLGLLVLLHARIARFFE